MPRLRFSWDAFDSATVEALASAHGYPENGGETARQWLGRTVKRPTPAFVGQHKDVLLRTWLADYEGAKDIVDRLLDQGIGPLGAPRSQRGYVEYIRSCRNSKSLRSFILEAMVRFGDRDHQGTLAEDFVPRFAVVSPAEQAPDTRKPYDFQREAWNALTGQLAEAQSTGVFRGLLVMPTGSGKTYTAVRWLLENVVAKGQGVLWLVHRQELITQAVAEFHRLGRLALPQQQLRVRAVSGAHCGSTQIDRADDIIVASVLSLKRDDIIERLLDGGRRFVVIDEAHHAPAGTYRKVIKELQQKQKWSLLGLTATPTRTAESERPVLQRLFGGKILHQVALKDLVNRGILAMPIPVRVATGADIDAQISQADLEYLERWRDLGEELKRKIADLAGRNRVIVRHYLDNREKYGPTLIFAIDVLHAHALTDALRQNGVRAEYVASYRHDDEEGDPRQVIQKFRNGELDVLVNVEIVTEGVDVPGIQTVFLTRPTMSEILMRQMIGRALRGEQAGGTSRAYLVSFEDHWDKFRSWTSPFDLVADVVSLAEPEKTETTEQPAVELGELLQTLPWDIIHQASAALRDLPVHMKADVFEAVPHGYLTFEREDEGEVVSGTVSVYQHQRPSWEALLARLESMSASEAPALSLEDKESLFEDFFGDCDVPQAPIEDVFSVIHHMANGGATPEFHDLEARRQCAPETVAKLIWEGDLGERARSALLEGRFTPLAKAVYGELREYRAAVEDALDELKHPKDTHRVVRAVPVFYPVPSEQMAPGPQHDLPSLLDEVLRQGADLLGVPKLTHTGPVGWSKRIVKGWYAMAYYDTSEPFSHGRIKVNCLLDSPDVSAATMQFLLWHEYLHLHLKQLHTAEFRRLERLWPNCLDADAELDNLNERFGVQYW